MAFIDELTIVASAGKGGDGVVRWRHEKYHEFMGPSGGDGGKGGDVYALAVQDIGVLATLAHKRSYNAADGDPGGNNSMSGKGGSDLVIALPVGSIITAVGTDKKWELIKEGEKVLLLQGGSGGKGNERYKSPSNQRPEQFTKGREGEEATLHIELQLIADVGLVGLPNAGKSSLLNKLTRAGAKVGDYAFTTLDPNLGAFYGYVIADIPGLIEGASLGKGLGHKFLRHIQRTKLLLHCISVEREDPFNDYNIVRNEILSHQGLEDKKEYIVLTKTDLISHDDLLKITEVFTSKGKTVEHLSTFNDDDVKVFGDFLTKTLREEASRSCS